MSTLKDVMRPRRRSWRSVQALVPERRSQPTSEPLTVAYANTDWAPELKWWMSTAQPSSSRSRDLGERTSRVGGASLGSASRGGGGGCVCSPRLEGLHFGRFGRFVCFDGQQLDGAAVRRHG